MQILSKASTFGLLCVLAGGVASLENRQNPAAGRLHPCLQLDELYLQPLKGRLVFLARHFLVHHR